MDISVTLKDFKMKFSMHVLKVLLEGTVSQIFYLGLSFYFIKKRVTFCYFSKLFFLDCIK